MIIARIKTYYKDGKEEIIPKELARATVCDWTTDGILHIDIDHKTTYKTEDINLPFGNIGKIEIIL